MKILIYFSLIASFSIHGMEKIGHSVFFDERRTQAVEIVTPEQSGNHKALDVSVKQPLSLRNLCLNRVSQLCATDARLNTVLLAGLPHDLASGLLERLKATITETKCIRSLDKSTQYKMSPDGANILVIPDDSYKPLCILDGKTGNHMVMLQESLTSDNKQGPFDNKRFIPIKWSSTGKYIYGCFFSDTGTTTSYLYKIWDAASGKIVYTIPFKPAGKLYFNSNDSLLLGKLNDKPLEIYEGATGIHKATLGQPTFSFRKQKNEDPQHKWLTVCEDGNTDLYDEQSLKLVQSIQGTLKCFNTDGSLFATHCEEVQSRGTPIISDDIFDTSHAVTTNTALIYNRKWETVARIPLKNLSWYSMSFSPSDQILRVYNADTEHHYSLATQKLVNELNHDKDKKIPLCFLDSESQGSLTLTKIKKGKTQITISNESINTQLECTQEINKVRYTHNKNIVALGKYKYVHFLLHLKTGILIPCNFELKKGLFSYRPIKELSCNECWINKTDSGQELVQWEHPPS